MSGESSFVAGESCLVQAGAIVGFVYKKDCAPARLGSHSTVRAGAIIYGDVVIGEYFNSGHNVLVREHTTIGRNVLLGTNTVIDGNVTIANFVSIQSCVYIPTHTKIGSRVFIGPGVTLTNDQYPLKHRDTYVAKGPTLEDGVTVGAGAVICPGVTVGADSFIAAGAVVTKDVPPRSFVAGVPGVSRPLPEKLSERNMALSWRKFLENDPVEKVAKGSGG